MGIERKKKAGEPTSDLGGLTLPGAFVAAAEAVEKDTDSAWALWQEANAKAQATATPETRSAPQAAGFTVPLANAQGDPRYAVTEPAGLQPAQSAAFTPHAKSVTVDQAMVEARRNNRVVPRPERWQQLFDMLPDKQQSEPAPPMVGKAWNTTASITKRNCLRQHLEWAASRGALDQVFSFLKALPENEWLHMDE